MTRKTYFISYNDLLYFASGKLLYRIRMISVDGVPKMIITCHFIVTLLKIYEEGLKCTFGLHLKVLLCNKN